MDLERIEALIKVIENARVTELAVKIDGSSVVVRKSAKANGLSAPRVKPVKGTRSTAAAEKTQEKAAADKVITAPMVGIFHTIEGSGEKGMKVKKGQVIGTIESMKLINEIRSQFDGTIEEAYAEDGMPVEYGQALFRLVEAA